MPGKEVNQPNSGLQQNASRGAIVAAAIVIVIALAAAAFYVINGGWRTTAMQQDDWIHRGYPLKMARKGDMSALEEENKLRKSKGQPLLVVPPDPRDLSPEAFKRSQETLSKALQNQNQKPQ